MTAPDVCRPQDDSPSAAPWFPEVGVVAMVPEAWGGPWTTRHHVLTRLAKYFRVVWVNPAREWRQAWWSQQSSRPSIQGTVGGSAGLTIYEDRFCPQFCRPRTLADFFERMRMANIRRMMQAARHRKVILYIWRPEFEAALQQVPSDVRCYHVDDEYTFSDQPQPIDPREMRLLSGVDQVFIHSDALMARKGHFNANTAVIPNGVDYQAFATPAPVPRDLQAVPHPRIGYVGVIKKRLDFDLLLELADRHRDYHFVFVGPQIGLSQALPAARQLWKMPNVHLLGQKPVHELPAYVQHMDVCMLCYRVSDYTNCIYPLKLHEYLAAGVPVIGSPIQSLQQFRDVVCVARTADEWSAALAQSIAPHSRSDEQAALRRRVASQYEWNGLVLRIVDKLCQRLGGDYPARLAQRLRARHEADGDFAARASHDQDPPPVKAGEHLTNQL